MPNISLGDRQALAAALARQAIANQAQNDSAEKAAALAVENLALRLGQQHGIDNAIEIIADVCRAMGIWAVNREHKAKITRKANYERLSLELVPTALVTAGLIQLCPEVGHDEAVLVERCAVGGD